MVKALTPEPEWAVAMVVASTITEDRVSSMLEVAGKTSENMGEFTNTFRENMKDDIIEIMQATKGDESNRTHNPPPE